MKRRFNYVFFDISGIKNFGKDKDNYFYICTEELQKESDIRVISYPMDYLPYIFHLLFTLHYYPKLNQLISLPFKSIWYPYYFKNDFKEERPLCFIMSAYYVTPEYLRYLKTRYPNSKAVLIHRDLIHLWHKRNPAFTSQSIKELFDLRMTYDVNEAKKYGLLHFDEFESKTMVPIAPQYPLSDVFFAGYAKNRLPALLCAYDILSANGLQCDFYIVGTSQDQRVIKPGIIYSDHQMSYREMLYRTVNSRCILEINQEGAVGYTSRFLEAVMYNKKLITNNALIKQSAFYHSGYIQCISDVNELDADFVKKDIGDIDYKYNGEFSPLNLINQIDRALP